MSKLEIYKGLAVVLFFPFIFGCLIVKSNITTLMSIDDAKPLTIKVDSLTSRTGQSGSNNPSVTAYFSVDGKAYMLGLTGDGAKFSNYTKKDSIDIWFRPRMKSGILRDINPTKDAWRKRYINYLFFLGGGLSFPFLIFLSLFLIEKRKAKRTANKEKE